MEELLRGRRRGRAAACSTVRRNCTRRSPLGRAWQVARSNRSVRPLPAICAAGYHRPAADPHSGVHQPLMIDIATDTRVIDAEAPQYNASLVRREDETDSLAYFWVRFDGDPTPFEPGQYMTIGVMVDGRIVQRPYSVASPPVVSG